MRRLATLSLLFAGPITFASQACSSDAGTSAGAPASDAASALDGPLGSDAGTTVGDAEGTGPLQDEAEPNNGALSEAGTPETNTMTVPGIMQGAIDPADDADIFSLSLAPGELWQWTLDAKGSPYVPHVTVFDTAENNLNPTVLVKAGAASVVPTLEHFVLRPGKFVAAVRDARNVPASSSAHAGSPKHTYSLSARRLTPQPKKVTLPETVTGALPTASSVALFTFSAKKDTAVEIVVKAARKTQPSALDSRMSLFNLTSKTAVLTNDNAGGATSDSEIRGPMPADADYLVILENEGAQVFDPASVPDLSYELDFKLK